MVTVFKSKEFSTPSEIKQFAAAFERVAEKHKELLSPAALQEYFQEIFWLRGDQGLDKKNIMKSFNLSGNKIFFDFRSVAEKYRLIEQYMLPVIIPFDIQDIGQTSETVESSSAAAILNRLKNSPDASPGKAARELQPYLVQVPQFAFEKLCQNGRVAYIGEKFWGNRFAVLTSPELYKPETGLLWEEADILNTTIF